jgi:hypothetical protein
MTDEGTMTWEYKKAAIFEPCQCDGPGVMGGINIKEDGNAYCTTCGKKLTPGKWIIFGCTSCVKPKLRELDDIEKEFYTEQGNR